MKKHEIIISSASKLSNSQTKKVKLWNLQIMKALANDTDPTCLPALETLLSKYQQEDPIVLEAALGALMEDVCPLELACDYCTRSVKPEYEAIILPRLKKNVSLLLKYGANPNLHSPHPLYVLFSDIENVNLPSNYEFKFADVVNELIDKGADLSLRHRNEMTVAHLAAALDRKRAVLPRILNAQPDLLDAKDSMGEQPLTTAIRFKNTAAVLEMIMKHQPNINARNSSGATALSAAIFYLDPLAADNLLTKGASLCLSGNMSVRETYQTGEAQKIKRLLEILAKAGYCIPFKKRTALHGPINAYLGAQIPYHADFLMILEDQESKHCQTIFTLEDLKKSQIKLSPERTKRLHQSFTEIIDHYILNGDSALKSIGEVYEIFKSKYPYDEPMSPFDLAINKFNHILNEVSEPVKKLGLEYFPIVLNDVDALQQPSQTTIEGYLKSIKNMIRNSEDREYSQADLESFIEKYGTACFKVFALRLSQGTFSPVFSNFFGKICYQFLMNVALRYIENSKSREELLKVHETLLFISSVAASYLLRNKSKSLDACLYAIGLIIDKYQQLGVQNNKTLIYVLMKQMFRINIYASLKFYPAVLSMLNEIGKNEPLLIEELTRLKKSDKDKNDVGIFSNLDTILNQLIDSLNEKSADLTVISSIVIKAEYFASTFSLSNTADACALRRKSIDPQYKSLLLSENIIPLDFETTGWFSLSLHGAELRLSFKEDISKTKVKNLFKSIDTIKSNSNGFYLPVYGMDLDEIRETVDRLRSISVTTLKKGESSTTPVAQSQVENIINESGFQAKYLPAPPSYASSSSSSKFQKGSISKQKEKEIVVVNRQAEFAAERDRVKQEIAQAQQVNGENVFHLAHPHFPDDKPLHAWAVWSEIRGNRRFVTDKLLQSHRLIAEAGRFCVKRGAQGLKSERVINPITGEEVWSIKTKQLGKEGDARIVAVPEDFHSQSLNDDVKIYKFGDIKFHK